MQVQQPVGKPRSMEKITQKSQSAIVEALNLHRGFVVMYGQQAIALIDQQTIGVDVINEEFLYLNKVPVVIIESQILARSMQGSIVTMYKTCVLELTCRGHAETHMIHVAPSSG